MFDIDAKNKVVIKEPQLLLIKEFKTLWDKDKTTNKEKALKEFAYIYFKSDFRSSYRQSNNSDDLPVILKKDLDFPSNWKPSKDLLAAENKYTSLQTTKSLKALLSAETALEQIITYFDTFDINKIDADKKADAISKLMNNIKNIDEVTGRLSSAKVRLEKELENKKMSGSKVLTAREMPKGKRK